MEHCLAILIEPLIGLFAVCTEVVAICLDGCLQTCRESCRCIGCSSPICASSNDVEGDEESRPILQQSQPSIQAQPSVNGGETAQPKWSSIKTLRGDGGRE